MADVTTELIRNVVLLSHSGAGKTILSESLLNQTGVTNRIGTVEDGTTVSDFEAEESKRGNSVQTSIMHAPWRNHKINILDTPGYADYRGEVVSGIRVADCAVIVVSAPSGLEVGTSQMWKMADDLSLPRIVYISKMDRENADFGRALDSLTERFGRHLVPLQVPVGSEASFSGVINVLAKDADVPEELQSEVDDAMERLTEAVAEIDDELADKYLEGEEITEVEIRAGLIKGIREATLGPVLAGSPPNSIGVTELLDVIADYMPSPADVGNVSVTTVGTDGESELACDSDGPLAALVFKTAADPFVGRLSYFRVYSGTLGSDSQCWNANKSEAERVGQVFVVNGKSQDSLDSLAAGDIGALSRLNSVVTGDTISSRENPIVIEGLNFPIPVHHMAVSPKTKADVDKMTSSLSRIVEEDPSLIVSRDEQTLEVIMQGLGDTHLDVAIEKMKRKFGVELEMSIPRVPYMETISRRARVEYRHKKQSGGHGQFGHVWLEVEPLPRGSGIEFAQSIVGGVVTLEYIPAVEKGGGSALDGGVVAGFPVIDFKATLVDGSFHTVDSSGVSFEIAGGHAATKGMAQAGPVLLEPIMKVDITVPDEFTGDIIGDLNGRRGRIQGMVPNGDGTTTINCEAPRAEMLTYATDLRSQTQGQGSFTLEFDHYEDVPQHLVDQVVQSMSGGPESAQARS